MIVMDNNKNVQEENYVEILKKAQEKVSKIVLPSMGLLNNEVKVNIKGNQFLNQKKSGKEN